MNDNTTSTQTIYPKFIGVRTLRPPRLNSEVIKTKPSSQRSTRRNVRKQTGDFSPPDPPRATASRDFNPSFNDNEGGSTDPCAENISSLRLIRRRSGEDSGNSNTVCGKDAVKTPSPKPDANDRGTCIPSSQSSKTEYKFHFGSSPTCYNACCISSIDEVISRSTSSTPSVPEQNEQNVLPPPVPSSTPIVFKYGSSAEGAAAVALTNFSHYALQQHPTAPTPQQRYPECAECCYECSPFIQRAEEFQPEFLNFIPREVFPPRANTPYHPPIHSSKLVLSSFYPNRGRSLVWGLYNTTRYNCDLIRHYLPQKIKWLF